MQLVSPCETRLSDIFDIWLWNTVEFSPEANSEEDERFKKELDSMKRKLLAETSKKFYEDLREEKVVEEFEQCIRIVYDEAKDSQLIATAKKKDHILHQWTFLRNHVPSLDEKIQIVMFRLVGRAAIARNGQTGCERANSTYKLFKTKLSSTMALEMVRARLRVSLNGPSLSMFHTVPIRKVWIEKDMNSLKQNPVRNLFWTESMKKIVKNTHRRFLIE